MIRLLLRLLGIRDFEICLSCETLKEQLSYERSEKRQLTETLLNIIQPKVVESAPLEINPIIQSSGLFARKRAILEQKDREAARIRQDSKHLGKPDNLTPIQAVNREAMESTEQLEHELGIVEEKTN